jgi:GMP reductase
MHIDTTPKLDFKDVLLRPKRSTLSSRADVDILRTFKFKHTDQTLTCFPIIASNMDTVGTFSMAEALSSFDSLCAIHKHYSQEKLKEFFTHAEDWHANTFYSLGSSVEEYKDLEWSASWAPLMLNIDVANGYQESFLESVSLIRGLMPDRIIMAGNVVTPEMTEALILAGADIVKVGIGSGSVCITRDVTGVGYPQLSAIIECADAAHGLGGHICSDGGCKTSGDIVKAFGAGADFVMLGGMLAGTDECEFKGDSRIEPNFYGMASRKAQEAHGNGVKDYTAAEGKAVYVPPKGPVAGIMREIQGGIRSAMTYIGSTKLKDIPKCASFVTLK